MSPFWLAVFSVLIGVFPLLVALFAMLIAKVLGCRLDESSKGECLFCGKDIGGVLYSMFVFAWLGTVTVGIAVLGLFASGIWALIR